MPRRPRSHQLEDLSRNRLHDAFNEANWTVEDLRKDYGEDLLVRIFDDQKATPLMFFVQARASDHVDQYSTKDGLILFPIEKRHFQHWQHFWEPVIVSLWDSRTDRTYWNCFQSFHSTEQGKKAVETSADSLRMPLDKLLDADAITHIHAIAKSRYERAEVEQQGAQALIQLLREYLKLEIEYDPRGGVLIVEPPGETPIFGFFGRTGEKLSQLAEHWGCSFEEAFTTMVSMLSDLMQSGGPTVRKNLLQTMFLMDKLGKFEEGDALLDLRSQGCRPRTKPGMPDINQLKRFLGGRRKRRTKSQDELPHLFEDGAH